MFDLKSFFSFNQGDDIETASNEELFGEFNKPDMDVE